MYELYCGDANVELEKIPDKSVDLVYIDIPYFYKYMGGGNYSELSKRIVKNNEELESFDIVDGIDYSIFDTLCEKMKKINIFVWCSKMQIPDILNYFNKKECFFEVLVWCKTNPTPKTKNTWLPDIEYCLYFREEGVPLNDGYDIKHKFYITPINKKDKDKWNHPTIKPLHIVENHILHTTKEHDVILDCFMGSGTTGVASIKNNRDFIGIEINPKFYQIAEERLKETIPNDNAIIEQLFVKLP